MYLRVRVLGSRLDLYPNYSCARAVRARVCNEASMEALLADLDQESEADREKREKKVPDAPAC